MCSAPFFKGCKTPSGEAIKTQIQILNQQMTEPLYLFLKLLASFMAVTSDSVAIAPPLPLPNYSDVNCLNSLNCTREGKIFSE